MKLTLAIGKMCLVAALAMTPAYAAVVVNDKTIIDLTVFVPCAANGAGELVALNGPLHTLVSFTINGNNVSGYFHSQPQGIVGVGGTTGTKYQATGITQQSFKTAFQNGQANLTYVNNFRIIGQGPGDNLLVHETLHITFNADGLLTVFHDNFNIDCK